MEVEIELGGYKYSFSKRKNELDEMVIKFSKILNEEGIKFVIISGYIAILFGRSRLSEDIDILVEDMNYSKFHRLWNKLDKDFWCIITSRPEDAYHTYLQTGHAIRFSLTNKIIPNIEIKFPKSELERWVLKNPLRIRVDDFTMPISNIELQIAFKLYLGSEKDIEDAKYLYSLFQENLDRERLNSLIKNFGIVDIARRYLGWNYPK